MAVCPPAACQELVALGWRLRLYDGLGWAILARHHRAPADAETHDEVGNGGVVPQACAKAPATAEGS